MGSLKLFNCDIGFTLNGQSYDFLHVDSVNVEDPERTRITRGSNAGDDIGIVYKEGIKEAKTITVAALEIPAALFNVLLDAYDKRTRFELVYVIDRSTGSKKEGKNAILSQRPQQMVLDETPDSMVVSLLWETFSLGDKPKDEA